MFDRSKINKILVVSLTNIGDVILTFPVLDILRRDFPSAKLSVVIGPKAKSLLCGNPIFKNVYIFDKHQPFPRTISWVNTMRRERFDLVIDLRNTAIPLMISARYRTPFHGAKIPDQHMRQKHLMRLKSVFDCVHEPAKAESLYIPENDKKYVADIIENEIGKDRKYVVVAPGAADSTKRWGEKNFARTCDHLISGHGYKIVFIGDEGDRSCVETVVEAMKGKALNLCGRTNLIQLAELFSHCSFALVNDSAPMHLASYMDVPVIALFGPTDPKKYGPWGRQGLLICKNDECLACRTKKKTVRHICMQAISSDDVLGALGQFIECENDA